MQVAALVGGADHEHTHVVGAGGFDRRAVVLADEVPMEIDVIEGVGGDRLQDQGQGGVGGEAHMADAAPLLPAAHHLQAAARAQALLQVFRQVEAMEGEQIKPLHPQPLEAERQFRLEGGRIRLG